MDTSDLDYLKKLVGESKNKSPANSAESSPVRKRDLEWTNVFRKYIHQINSTCVFMHKGHHLSTAKEENRKVKKQFLMSADAKCSFTNCTCTTHSIVYTDGTLKVKFEGKICHSPSEQRSHPYRGSFRRAVAEALDSGQTADQYRLKQMNKLTDEHRTFGNNNLIGSSPHVFRKIRSEMKTSLMLDKDLWSSLIKIKEEQSKEINSGRNIAGYLQSISIDPLRLVFYTEAALVLWKQVGKLVPVSWDATGGIVMSHGQKVFYYELTIANISPKAITNRELSGPSFPVTVMVSASHKTNDLVQWLNEFEAAYHKMYGFKEPFPRPPVVHSDGALVFQKAALRVFNGDSSINVYLQRCWTIVSRTAKGDDINKTIIHSCFSHFMKTVKREAMKNYSKDKVSSILVD